MVEQLVRAWVLPSTDLYDVVGSRNLETVRRALSREDLVEYLDQLLGEISDLRVEDALGELIRGELQTSHAYAYARTLEVLLEEIGTRLSPEEVTLDGRWQSLGETFAASGQTMLGERWRIGSCRFPWRDDSEGVATGWPIPMLFESRELEAARAEVEAAREAMAQRPLDGALAGREPELSALLGSLGAWFDAGASHAGEDVIVLLDGQQ